MPLAALAAHYVRLTVPAAARGVAIAVPGGATQVALVLGGPKGRVVRAVPFRPGGGAVVTASFRSAAERRDVLLVITSGAATPGSYGLIAARDRQERPAAGLGRLATDDR